MCFALDWKFLVLLSYPLFDNFYPCWTLPAILASIGLEHSRQSQHVVFFLARNLMTERSMDGVRVAGMTPTGNGKRPTTRGMGVSHHWGVCKYHHRPARYLIQGKLMRGQFGRDANCSRNHVKYCRVKRDVPRVFASTQNLLGGCTSLEGIDGLLSTIQFPSRIPNF